MSSGTLNRNAPVDFQIQGFIELDVELPPPLAAPVLPGELGNWPRWSPRSRFHSPTAASTDEGWAGSRRDRELVGEDDDDGMVPESTLKAFARLPGRRGPGKHQLHFFEERRIPVAVVRGIGAS